MGFSPIVGGGTITAHTHTNAANDGGALNETTLFKDATLISWMVSI